MSPLADARFVTGSLWRHVVVMSLTSSIGLMAIFAVDLVDMIFIAMLGNAALAAAIGYAGTILFFTNAINIGVSIAAGALVARAVGAGQHLEAREVATSVASFGLLTALVVPAVILSQLTSILALLGATGEVLAFAWRYCAITLPAMGLMSLAMTSMAVMRGYGDATRPMWVTLAGGVVNAILDPLLIFGFGLGLDGAAIAAVCGRFALAALAVGLALRHYSAYVPPSAALLRRDFAAVSRLAFPAVLTNVATPVGAGIMTRIMAGYGTDAVAGMAIIARLTPVAFAVTLALSGAIGPIIGQNAGAGQPERVRGAFTAALQFTALYVLGAALILAVLRDTLAAAFQAEGLTRDLLVLFCGPLALFMFFNGAIFVANASLNNLGRPFQSTAINWGRHTLGTAPFAIAGGTFYGAAGALIGQALGGVVFAIIAIVVAIRAMKAPAAPEPFAEQRQWHHLWARFGVR
jgi:putative MATE family efflux protein